MNEINKHYDILVVGAGMIGSSIAIGLAKEGCRVLLIEHIKPVAFDSSKIYPDLRVSALNYTSVNLLKQLGVWNNVLKMRVAPYKKLEIWEKENTNVTFESSSLGLPTLGYVIENRILQLASWQQFSVYSNITLLCPLKLVAMKRHYQQWKITLNNNQQFLINLVIAADGTFSKVRSLVGISSNGWQYNQLCLLITAKVRSLQHDVVWQQFFPSGPRAFLPLFDHWACLIWYDKPSKIKQLESVPVEQLKKEITLAFPTRFDLLQIVNIGDCLLNRHHASRYIEDGLVLIGDAAHSVHPLAGQGANLGYRDVSSLLKVLINANKNSLPLFTKNILLTYQKDRMLDNKLMQISIDILYILFSSRSKLIKFSRNLTLILLQRLNNIKKEIMKYVLGL